MTTVTRTAGGAVALLLRRPRDQRPTDGGLTTAVLGLREIVGPQIRELVDGWLAGGGPDGEQVYCLDQLLRDRFDADPQFQAAVEKIVAAGEVTPDAVGALAQHCRIEGYLGAQAWCQAVLLPSVLSATLPVTAPR